MDSESEPMRLGTLLATALAVASVFVAIAGTSLAQPAGAETPQATDCQVEPRTLDEIGELVAAWPESLLDQRPQSPTSPTANPDVEVSADNLVRERVVCTNANDPLRWLALCTDEYVGVRLGIEHPDDLESLVASMSRATEPAGETDVLELSSVVVDEVTSAMTIQVRVVTENRNHVFDDLLELKWVQGELRVNSLLESEISDSEDGNSD